MNTQFATEQFELVNSAKIHITNHQFGHNRQGEMDVWIEGNPKGERFLSQLQVQGELYAVRKEIYSKKCYILREKSTGIYWFLDKNDCGFWLQTASFNGAKTFRGDQSTKIDEWLIQTIKVA
jgi:hypothetical protein